MSDAQAKVRAIVRTNLLKDVMKAGGLASCYTMTLSATSEMVHLAKLAGYESVAINLEHQRTGFENTVDACCAALAHGITPVIVVPSLQSDWISRLLDNGAQTIIVPRTGTAAMARELVKYSKHRPIGERPLAYTPQMQYTIYDFKATQEAANDTTLSCPMIETVEGVDNCEEIAAVPGIDMIFIGAHDLSDDMGIPGMFDEPRLEQAIYRICAAANKEGIKVGIGGLESRLDLLVKWRKANPVICLVNAGRDIIMLKQGMAASVARIKALE